MSPTRFATLGKGAWGLCRLPVAGGSFRTVRNFIAIAYLRMAKLKDLPTNPFAPAAPIGLGVTPHVL
ncbi:hypothetical protein [Acidovorax sp. SUPP3334]|uniref:hypothetical protein n=1 Tax=Acidovorax sp. SUPP3334 TaxID=2920881 RepID=UPI0023DE298D|nr:hypothetical protein [Acidovorax sp. SUPP3334]GKT26849.1 hypothetical protein AVHM3334_22195 [Acidovorax sp. SUPP3334]